MVLFSMSSYTTRWGWSLSFSELRTRRKVRKCRILTICADLSISTFLSITWPSCNVSGRIACRALAPTISDPKDLALLWMVKIHEFLDRFILGEFWEMWLFFMVLFSMSSYTTRWGWSLSFSELRTGRKVRKCRILTICADLSISTYLSITWPSCNFSGHIGFIFGLHVGRWHPQFSDPKNLALLWIV